MRAGAVGELRFVTIGALRAARGAQRIVCAASGGTPFGVSSFWIWHSLRSFGLKFLQGRPAVIHLLGVTSTVDQVTILPANRTDPLALFAANSLHRHGEQHIFSQNILQFDTAAFIKSDLGLAGIDFDIFLARHFGGGPVKEIEAGAPRDGIPPRLANLELPVEFERFMVDEKIR